VPDQTARVARAAFPKGNVHIRLRDELGPVYDDAAFAPLFPARGQPAWSPWRLALVLVMQFVEGLPDRQAADAVGGRIDWKYTLSLELDDAGFDYSVLCEFRARLVAGAAEQRLLDAMLAHLTAKGLLKAGGRQRTDSTRVLAAVRTRNRLERVGETLRAALNALAVAAPGWLAARVAPDWYDRYGARVEETRLPTGEPERAALAGAIGADGLELLAAIYDSAAPSWLRELPAVETLRQLWVHRYCVIDGQVRLRGASDLPPASIRFDSPYDPDARYGVKRSTTWTGSKVHLTETCDPGAPHLISNVETTLAPLGDVEMTAPIHAGLARKDLLPSTHLVDAGYVDADLLAASHTEHHVELLGPAHPDISRQAKAGHGDDSTGFAIDWAAQQVTCPAGKTSVKWIPHHDPRGNPLIHVAFARPDCRGCPSRALCTRPKSEPRELTLRRQAEHEALQHARQQQTTPEWKDRYAVRAGVEGTISQGVRASGLRRSRYLGLAKTHLQHVLTAAAMNLVRADAWLAGVPHAITRTSRLLRCARPASCLQPDVSANSVYGAAKSQPDAGIGAGAGGGLGCGVRKCVHAARRYSWRSPPSKSCRRTAPLSSSPRMVSRAGGSGGCSPSARWGR